MLNSTINQALSKLSKDDYKEQKFSPILNIDSRQIFAHNSSKA